MPEYTEDEKKLAKAYARTIPREDMANAKADISKKTGVDVEHYEKIDIDDTIAPYVHNPDFHSPGSTDVGDVSYCAPTAQCHVATVVIGTPGHSWQMTGQGATSYCHKGVITAAKVMALTALKCIENPEIIEKAKADSQE